MPFVRKVVIAANHYSCIKLRAAMRKLLLLLAFLSIDVSAQSFVLDVPLKSQAAEVSQRIGLTEVTVRYHRPLVNGRKIWGDLVPYGEVWRAGANVNTTVTFSDPVIVEGKPLDRGTYGVHMIPTASDWTVILSRNATSWGSFTYDAHEDALRVQVTPHPSEFRNELTYEFEDVRDDAAIVALKWEKLTVPVHIGVFTKSKVLAALQRPLEVSSDPQHAFDFEIGKWKTHLRRLKAPLTGSQDWIEMDGTTLVRKVWGGRANLVELEVDGPGGHFAGLSLRLYNPESKQWTLNYANVKQGVLAAPTAGGFKEGRGEFYDDETIEGKRVRVRFIITPLSRDEIRFEQAYSPDGGRTWETNWVATDTRIEK
jgi:hypothetical protein